MDAPDGCDKPGLSRPHRPEAFAEKVGIYWQRPWLAAWLVLESAVNLTFAAWVIPDFYFRLPFLHETTLNGNCVDELRDKMRGNHHSSINPNAEIAHLNSPACQNTSNVILATSTDELLDSSNPSNLLFGCVLLVCGLLAPMSEMVGRLLFNMLRLALVERVCPKFVRIYEHVFEWAHCFLQHLTQFKVYLCFLELLLCVDLFGINVMRIRGGPGVDRFVLFTMWSIVITTIVGKIERDGGVANFLPPKDWLPKQLGAYTGSDRGTITIKNMVMLLCFFIFISRSPFTLVLAYNKADTTDALEKPLNATQGVQHASFHDKSFGPITNGFERMWNQDFKAMWFVIVFQVIVCNIIIPIVQLAHVLLQECMEAWFGIQLGWYPHVSLQKYVPDIASVAPEEANDGNVAEMVEEDGGEGDEDVARPKQRQIRSARDIIEIVCYLCTENQAHEFFVCGMAMLLNVVENMITEHGLDYDESRNVNVGICFNPMVLACFLCGVVFLGRPRRLLHLEMDMEAEKEGRWSCNSCVCTRMNLWMRMKRVIAPKKVEGEDDQQSNCSRMKLCTRFERLIAPENWFVIRQLLLVCIFAYLLAFRGPVTNYFGDWTLNEIFVSNTFHCTVTAGQSRNCLRGKLPIAGSQSSTQGQLMTTLSAASFAEHLANTANRYR